MLTPYYKDAQVTLYLADCNDVLPELWEPAIYDLLLTDPPFGIGRDGQSGPEIGAAGARKAHGFGGWDDKPPSKETFSLMFRSSCAQIIWGGNFFVDRIPAARGWFVWDKIQRIIQSDGELAYTSIDQPLRIVSCSRSELNGDGAVHPTQKPIKLMKWCISQVPWAKNVLDPFCGSGSSLLAAKEMGLRACGVEISERYAEIAANRLRQSVLSF
jgi:site-specific DNA-methyltransferase (adenine-specific)